MKVDRIMEKTHKWYSTLKNLGIQDMLVGAATAE
jgi:hypothetical protein